MKRNSKRILVLLLSTVVFVSMNIMSVSASSVQLVEDSTTPIKIVESQRNFTENIMNVYVWIENCIDQPITIKGNLSVPDTFELGLESENGIDFDKEGNIQFWSVINPREVKSPDEPFKLVTDEVFFIEPTQFRITLEWAYVNGRELDWHKVTEIIYPARGIDSNSGDGGLLRATFGVDSVSVSGESTNSDKGTPIHFVVTFINWGSTSTGTLSVNIKISEDSNLYLGFDQGVWAFSGNGKNTGKSLRAPRWYEDFVLGTYHLYVGPYLNDDDRGIWALNGMTRVNGTCVPEPLGYKGTRATCWSATKGAGNSETGIWSFNVNDTGDHDIFVATIRDNYWAEMSSYSDETEFFEYAVNFPMVVRLDTGYDSEVSSFTDWFDFTFHTKHIDTLTWDSEAIYVDVAPLRNEAKRRTAKLLGDTIGIGSAMCSAHLDDGVTPTLPSGETFTMRENHGFDIGFGFIGIPRINEGGENKSRSTGVVWAVDAAIAITMLNPELSNSFNQTIGKTIHELTHLFSGIHLDSPYPCIMDGQGTQGDHTGDGALRMNTLTEGNISLSFNLLQFAGAARPMTIASQNYGQWGCHTFFIFTAPTSPAQYVYSYLGPNEYFWEYTGWYDYFSITSNRTMYNVTADNNEANNSYYYVGYNLNFDSAYWPTGFNPSTTQLKVNIKFNITALSDISLERYAYVRLVSANTTTPSLHASWSYWFADNNDIEEYTELSSPFTDTDASVWLLFGLKDAHSEEHHQQMHVWMNLMDLFYEYGYTP